MKPMSSSRTLSPGKPISRLTNVVPASPGRQRFAFAGALKTTIWPPLRAAEVVGEPVHEHAVAHRCVATVAGPGAVQRVLHRGGRDAVRLRHLRLEGEHEPDRHRDRDGPVEDLPPGIREAVHEGEAHDD
jgi:hypothetical protein